MSPQRSQAHHVREAQPSGEQLSAGTVCVACHRWFAPTENVGAHRCPDTGSMTPCDPTPVLRDGEVVAGADHFVTGERWVDWAARHHPRAAQRGHTDGP